MDPISGKHQIGAVLAGAGWVILFRRGLALAPTRPHSPERLIFVLYAIIASVLLAYAWGVLMAFVARRREWTPQRCRSAGFPLMLFGLFAWYLAVVGSPHLKAIADSSGVVLSGVIAMELSGRLCRKLTYPELGWSGKDPMRTSLHINPWPPRQDTFGNRP